MDSSLFLRAESNATRFGFGMGDSIWGDGDPIIPARAESDFLVDLAVFRSVLVEISFLDSLAHGAFAFAGWALPASPKVGKVIKNLSVSLAGGAFVSFFGHQVSFVFNLF